MVNHVLVARFEEQVEELTDRLHECLQLPPSRDADIAREILQGLLRDYQAQLSELRTR